MDYYPLVIPKRGRYLLKVEQLMPTFQDNACQMENKIRISQTVLALSKCKVTFRNYNDYTKLLMSLHKWHQELSDVTFHP
jgi:lantibiotic modifying enzyme